MARFEVLISGTMYGQLFQNKLCVDSGDVGQSPQEVALNMEAFWVNVIKQPLPNNVVFRTIFVQNLENNIENHTRILSDIHGSQLGDDQLFTFVSWKLLFKTGVAGKKFRGRSYIPGVLKGFHTNGMLNAAGVQQWAQVLQDINNQFTSGQGVLRLCIRGDSVEHFTPVISIQLSNVPGVQRRRNIGVGL